MNDQVTHLNYARGEHADKPLDWTVMQCIRGRIRESVSLFKKALKDEYQDWAYEWPAEMVDVTGLQEMACNEIFAAYSKEITDFFEQGGTFTCPAG